MKSSQTSIQDTIEFIAELSHKAERAVTLAGEGLFTPSGIPDFHPEGSSLRSHKESPEAVSVNTFRTEPGKFYG